MATRLMPNPLAAMVGLALIAVALERAFPPGEGVRIRAAEDNPAATLSVGAAAVPLEADDNMVIGGGIFPGKAKGQEGQLRAVAVVLEMPAQGRMAIVACDVLMLSRDLLDPVAEEISNKYQIPAERLLIHATHTHHAPSTVTVHGYQREELFCRRVQQGIVQAVGQAVARLQAAEFYFALGQEATVGQNSRWLLKDGTIFWIGPRDDAVRPTGPFDPDLPVLAFRAKGSREKWLAVLFNHSTHTIGTRQPGVRSPSFYGLAAQELEQEIGGVCCFLQGASGSTHNLGVPVDEAILRIQNAVREALQEAQPRRVAQLRGLRQAFRFRVRHFDEAREDEAVSRYCRRRAGNSADGIIEVFRQQRKILAPLQGQERETWLQVLQIGDVALVGVPAEFFTKLGLDIKRRSPFRYTYIAELANDWIGYLPDRRAFDLGGYQTWTGLHSYAEAGTGERVVHDILALLHKLHQP
ncbi:MAG: hypothetical protein NZM42_09735 [Gemmatales bacterium]|nr:hypothetical protein [Gemmatales bacterium]